MVQTDYYRATLRRYGFDDRKIVTFRHVVAVKEVPFRERSIEGHRVRILTIARLVSKKGLEYGIRAAVALRAALPRLQIEYRIIGEGPLFPALTTLIRDLQTQETVTLLGAMTSPDVLRWVHASDLFLLPSLMEQAGYVVHEAQASGLPVVATRVGGVPEMVREGRSALLVPAGGVPSMLGALRYLVDHPEIWPSMGRQGRDHVEQHHNIDLLKIRLAEIVRG